MDEHDVVVAVEQINPMIPIGSEGTIIHVYPNYVAFEVEFTVKGTTTISDVKSNQIKLKTKCLK